MLKLYSNTRYCDDVHDIAVRHVKATNFRVPHPNTEAMISLKEHLCEFNFVK